MKNEIAKLRCSLPQLIKAPRLTLALMSLWIVSKAIEAIAGINSYSFFSLTLISLLAVLSLIFAYRSFDKF